MAYAQNPKSEMSKTVFPNSKFPNSETPIAEITNSEFSNTETLNRRKYRIRYFSKCGDAKFEISAYFEEKSRKKRENWGKHRKKKMKLFFAN